MRLELIVAIIIRFIAFMIVRTGSGRRQHVGCKLYFRSFGDSYYVHLQGEDYMPERHQNITHLFCDNTPKHVPHWYWYYNEWTSAFPIGYGCDVLFLYYIPESINSSEMFYFCCLNNAKQIETDTQIQYNLRFHRDLKVKGLVGTAQTLS